MLFRSLAKSVGIGGNRLRQLAQAALEVAEKNAVPQALIAENEDLRRQMAELAATVHKLTDSLEETKRAAGASVIGDSDAASLIADAAQAAAARKAPVEVAPPAAIADDIIPVPATYKKMRYLSLREICEQITAAPVTTKQECIDIIDEYLKAQPTALQPEKTAA